MHRKKLQGPPTLREDPVRMFAGLNFHDAYCTVRYPIIYSISYCAISHPEPCSGISILLPVDYHHHQVESINIIQQTPPSLS
jgi:hypothetical protein